MTTDKDKPGDPSHDSPKRHGDKLGQAVGGAGDAAPPAEDKAGDPAHDSPKRHGDKLEHARDAAAGHGKTK
jgi:hypothetical protein